MTVRCYILLIVPLMSLLGCGGSYSFDFERRNKTKTTKNTGSPIVSTNAVSVDINDLPTGSGLPQSQLNPFTSARVEGHHLPTPPIRHRGTACNDPPVRQSETLG
jgi:hypothetical protein